MSATALLVLFVWWVVALSVREEWRSATTTSGGRSVMIAGVPLMLEWPADSLGSLHMVSESQPQNCNTFALIVLYMQKQVLTRCSATGFQIELNISI